MKIALKPKFKYFMLPKYSGLIRFPSKAKIKEFIKAKAKYYVPDAIVQTIITFSGSKVEGKKGKNKISAQAIGGAVSHNPIALIIPCHRVIGTNGSLTGYAWGLERKRKLLFLEKAIPN